MAVRVPRICQPSAIYDDWVIKGFHILVNGVELRVRPGHTPGMVVFKRFFSADSRDDVDAARRIATAKCLSSVAVRRKWIDTLVRARDYLDGYDGMFPEAANGRKYEFRRLEKALLAFKVG
jgi:hypothetical protein